ncbi:uncharacterized protein LOC128233093 [Mya arenaria]|uniref:uncharacterized protein LOC128232863 n=1 Tax=Mya arenaria TaxID=6604 RepID=UPI0022E40BCD|nr:uncharacterized protein LOC128232863 [Mya arenaria]XP_052802937.1 uncharacterized protein LOC128233093 [Mya arenaria]
MKRVGDGIPPITGRKRMAMEEQSHISNPNAGAAIFFCNYGTDDNTCSNNFKFRENCAKDLDNVQSVFIKSLRFDWLNEDKLNRNLFINDWDHTKNTASGKRENCGKCLKCLIINKDFSNYKYLVLAISSHGLSRKGEQYVHFLSSTEPTMLSLSEVLATLSDTQCPTLKGKPRIVIVQACRTDSEFPTFAEDRGVVFYTEQHKGEKCAIGDVFQRFEHLTIRPVDESNAGLMEDAATPTTRQGNAEPITVLVPADETDETKMKVPKNFLVIYPTAPYRNSKRNENEGSWFEFHLKEVVDEYKHPTELDFLQILTETSRRVSKRETVVYKRNSTGDIQYETDTGCPLRDEHKSGMKNVVWVEHRLTQPLVFRTASGN